MTAGKVVAAAMSGVLSVTLGVVLLGADDDQALASASIGGQLDSGVIPNGWGPWVARAGALCPEIPSPVIAAQIEAESNWNPRAVSPVGALGLSQFMPGTWAAIGRDDDGNGIASPYDPGDAIMAQGRYDCQIVAQLRGKVPGELTQLALAGYNAGPGAVLQFGGIPPYPETQAYVPRILALAAKYSLGVSPGAPATEKASAVIEVAQSKLGTPYAYGGGGPYGPGPGWYGGTIGWDCSSFMQYAFWQGAHVMLPRVADAQGNAGHPVPRAQMQPGDIVVVGTDHVGIYIGNGQMIHEPSTGDVAKVSTIVGNSYWESRPWRIRRYL